jgi:hypothetical protein
MSKKYQKLDEIGNKNPFKVPEKYFENLPGQIRECLTDVEVEPLPAVNLWGRMKPWAYMAAMFAGIALMFKLFSGDMNRPETYAISGDVAKYGSMNFFENENEDDVLDYFENQTIESNYREIVYIGE